VRRKISSVLAGGNPLSKAERTELKKPLTGGEKSIKRIICKIQKREKKPATTPPAS
jgi:hypothetical protein